MVLVLKGQKYSLRRAQCKKLQAGGREATQQDGTTFNQLVLKKNETERVF